MNNMRLSSFTMLAAISLLFTACMSFNDDYFDPVADSMRTQMPELALEREIAMDFGSGFFNIIDLASAGAADVSDMENLRIAVYKVIPRGESLDFSDAVFDEALRSQGTELEWERIVRVREEGEQLWVFAGMDLRAEMLDALCVFILDHEELVLINMEGDLQQLLRYALETGNRTSAKSEKRT